MEKNFKHHSKEKAFEILKEVLQSPHDYASDEVLGSIAKQLLPKPEAEGQNISLNQSGIQFNVFGRNILKKEPCIKCTRQLNCRSVLREHLMPDAHSGYGLPIGGVLATENAVIPYGVGVDIGCRMCLSVFDIDPKN
jgi:tRNA-splicing ligase RtcB